MITPFSLAFSLFFLFLKWLKVHYFLFVISLTCKVFECWNTWRWMCLYRFQGNSKSPSCFISEFTEVFEFKDNKPTKNVRGYKAEFVISEGGYMEYSICSWVWQNTESAEIDANIQLEYDREESSVYTSKNKYGLQFKLVGLTNRREDKKGFGARRATLSENALRQGKGRIALFEYSRRSFCISVHKL